MQPVIWLDKDSPSVDLRPKGIRIGCKRIKIRGGMCEGYDFLGEKGIERAIKIKIKRERERERERGGQREKERERERERKAENEKERDDGVDRWIR